MKRFWLVLLLVMAFSTSVFAADVKFTGSFYAAGMYQDKVGFNEDINVEPSTSFYYQRLRVQMDFVATPYLKLITRFDAMERVWGGVRSANALYTSGAFTGYTVTDIDGSMGTRGENENIAFDYAYIWYASKVGIFTVGYQADGAWGTVFANNEEPEAKIAWMLPKMPFIVGLQIVKFGEKERTMVYPGVEADVDSDKYQGFVIYNFKGGQAGLLGGYIRNGEGYLNANFSTHLYFLQPYAKVKIGPVAIEAEVDYMWGKYANWADGVAFPDVKVSNLQAYVDALADFGMFYVGGTAAFIDGDKQSSGDKLEGGVLNGGRDWNPCLLMFNWDRYYWAGPIATVIPAPATTMAAPMSNAYFFQVRGGVRPIADLDIMASVAYAKAVRTGFGGPVLLGGTGVDYTTEKDYGYEVDVTATYKITNNLTYMLGGAYLFTGDYWKTVADLDVDDNFLIINKLTLTF